MSIKVIGIIDAPHFYCAIVLRDDVVVRAAPIVKYMVGWHRDQVRAYCLKKKWRVFVAPSRAK